MSEKLEIKLVKSKIGLNKKQLAIIRTLGLNKLGSSVIKTDNDSLNGMLKRMCHVLKIKKV